MYLLLFKPIHVFLFIKYLQLNLPQSHISWSFIIRLNFPACLPAALIAHPWSMIDRITLSQNQ